MKVRNSATFICLAALAGFLPQTQELSGRPSRSKLTIRTLTATAIRFAKLCDEPIVVVCSNRDRVQFAFMSKPMRDYRGLTWIRKHSGMTEEKLDLFVSVSFWPSGSNRLAQRSSFVERCRTAIAEERVTGFGILPYSAKPWP